MRRWLAAPLAFALALAPILARAQETQRPRDGSFSVGFGAFNMGHANTSGGVGMEYHLDNHPWKPRSSGRLSLIPTLGITGTSKDAWFGYVGFRADLNVTQRWRL